MTGPEPVVSDPDAELAAISNPGADLAAVWNPDEELAALTHFLRAQRGAVLAIVEGLDDAALHRVLPFGWSVLGLIEHLAHAERHWFQEVLLGRAGALPWPDPGTPLRTDRSAQEVYSFYRDQGAISDEQLAAHALTTRPIGAHPPPLGEEITDLRRLVLHVIEETARHAGHLDLARQLLDGSTGLGPR